MAPKDLRRLFVRRLLERREELGWSQSELARRSSVAQKTISLLEQGDTDPTLSTLGLLAEALGFTPDEMIAA